jgi:hypothetical protein
MLTWKEFKGTTADDWMQKALTDLKGKVAPDQLQSRFGEEITMSPFLTRSPNAASLPISGNRIRPAVRLTVTDEKTANDTIHKFLHWGTEALWLHCEHPINLSVVLEGVYLDILQTFIYAPDEIVSRKLESQISENYGRYYDEGHVQMVHQHAPSAYVHLPLHQTLSERLEHFVSVCLPYGKAGKKVHVHIEPVSDFLRQIAELRAFRRLWTEALLPEASLLIFTCISDQHFEKQELHAMLPASYLILSAQFGMSDFLLDNLRSAHGELSRLVLNAQHIFQYESGVGRVQDPFAGSYIIEKLTEEIILMANT